MSASETCDFDLGGAVGVRLAGAGPSERAAVERQLGPIQRPLAREPDVLLRFVERLESGSDLRHVGLDDAAFDDQRFLLLRGKHKSRLRVCIPFEQVGQRCEITCERGLAAVPLLVPILNATMLAKGFLPLHAAAFVQHGKGVIATGWSKGGKTETLLAFMARGARYVADEWLYLSGDGQRMFGIPEPIRVWGWHLDSLAELRGRLSRAERARLSVLGLVASGMRRVTADGERHGSAATRSLNRAAALVRSHLFVDLPPERLFPGAFAQDAPGHEPVRPAQLLFVTSAEGAEITLRPIPAREVAERMRFSLLEEFQPLLSAYRKFRFAFPARTNELLENLEDIQRERLHSALDALPALEVRHPYPVSLPALHDALSEACGAPVESRPQPGPGQRAPRSALLGSPGDGSR